MQNNDETYIEKCLKLAIKGKGYVEPNPLVGCIIIKNGKIIGKGYHKKFGESHAEVNAINDALKRTKSLKGCTLYVNLEPCSHFGKTPPCTDLIIKHKFSKVVIGLIDPNPNVDGKGIKKLKKAGINVTSGILSDKCKEINKTFITNILYKRPYITLKVAQSLDGKIALNNFKSKWITDINSRKLAHLLRSQNDCILIGKNSIVHDNPELTVRLVNSNKSPVRIVIDKNLTLNDKYNVLQNTPPLTIVFHSGNKTKENREFIKYYRIKDKNGTIKMRDIAGVLYKMGYYTLLVEGGANVYSQFIKENLFDEINFFIAPKIIGEGLSSFADYKIDRIARAKELFLNKISILDKDIMLNYKNYK